MAPPSAAVTPSSTALVNVLEEEVIPSQRWLNSKKFSVPGKEFKEYIDKLGRPHIESFNNIITGGLQRAVMNMDPVIFKLPDGREVGLHPKAASIGVPEVEVTRGTRRGRVYPSECRQSGDTYDAPLHFTFSYSIDGEESPNITRHLGEVPIMVKSLRCNLHGLTPAELVEIGEEENEIGGYFVVKGHEKLIRMLVATRRNYPLAMIRNGWKSRGDQFSEYGVFIRSVVADDHTATNNVLHYLRDGSAKFMLAFRKEMFFVKVMLLLKTLCPLSDAGIYEHLIAGREHDTSFSRRIQGMMRELNEGDDKLVTQMDALKLLGSKFRPRVELSLPPSFTDIAIAQHVMKYCVLPHLKTNEEKFRLLVFMTQKLYAFIANETCAETSDSVFSWEVYLGGDVYLQVLKDSLYTVLTGARAAILKKANLSKGVELVVDEKEIISATKTASKPGPTMEKFLATGRVNAGGNLLMPQMEGLTIVVENISWARYLSHFQSIHRGSFFLTMRSTDVRKLTADSWGFVCPVHTPDGEPCGLLNHLAKDCEIVTDYIDTRKYPEVFASIGMAPVDGVDGRHHSSSLVVLLNGNVVGSVSKDYAEIFVRKLRKLKVQDLEISKYTEIGYVPELDADTKDKGVSGYLGGQYPGIFLFTTQNRMMRRVINMSLNEEELVGSMEQLYLHIAVKPDEVIPGVTSHMEVSPTSMMSSLANLIPLPDCNQSPRNMYQCQMAKQTIGVPFHNLKKRPESKLYRLNIPTSPFFRTRDYDLMKMDEYASGTNAIVAVMAYTSYDMEDAMCLNKASRERGLAHATVFKSEIINLKDASLASFDSFFQRDPKKPELAQYLDVDGLPYPGSQLTSGAPYYCYYTSIGDKHVVVKYKRSEVAFVDTVRVLGPKNPINTEFRVGITLRVERNPSIGDKFASRAGQKGICSMLWPVEDMPWTESGLVPDIIFNPHGLPSRMTMAKVIEIMAGKSAALHGAVFDATPFEFDEKETASAYFGNLLEKAGYNRHGTEIMYSGTTGKPFPVEVFMGIVHYQRLRHMVLDKWQVRSRGPMNNVTHQPIKGRKRGGGIRVGEMERDAIIGNGCLELITDRLLNNSDGSKEFVCVPCGSVLSPCSLKGTRSQTCMMCGSSDGVTLCMMPYTLKLLCAQLASVNLRVRIGYEETKASVL